MSFDSHKIEKIFNRTFFHEYNTRLEGGAEEPEYIPKSISCDHHRLCYREDFFASALHEISHWCIAGERRRGLKDFGYWYESERVDSQQQEQFELAESKPQAIELLFSVAAGFAFKISVDNLESDNRASRCFVGQIIREAQTYMLVRNLTRAERFIDELTAEFTTFSSRKAFSDAVHSSLISLARTHDIALDW